MKKLNLLLVLASVTMAVPVVAQDVSVDEIINGYFENTGGKGNWATLKGVKVIAKVNQGGLEIPLEIVFMADGRQYTKYSFQSNEFMQGVYDGETLWNTNFQTLKAEKADAEQTANMKLDANDFPDSFLNYKSKNYTAELLGTETIDGAETYKVRLTREPKTYDGNQVEDVVYYYFDSEAYILIAQDSEVKTGSNVGTVQRITQSDYQEVDGLYFPFSMTQGPKDGPSQPIIIERIELNPEIDESLFNFPEQAETEVVDK